MSLEEEKNQEIQGLSSLNNWIYSKHLIIHFWSKRNFETGFDCRIFSLRRSTVIMKFKEANIYD